MNQREAVFCGLSATRELLQPTRMTQKGVINTWQAPLLSAPARQAVARDRRVGDKAFGFAFVCWLSQLSGSVGDLICAGNRQ